MQGKSFVAAIVVHWNNLPATSACIRSLERTAYGNLRVIVVDNGSDNGSGAAIARRHPTVTLVGTGANTGFGTGANAGMDCPEARCADYFWILNNDLLVTPNALSALVGAMDRDPRIGMAGPVLRENSRGRRIEAAGGRVSFVTGLADNDPARSRGRIDYIKGACILVRAAAIRDAGGFDGRFFLYWEDTDLGFRLRSRGWRLAVVSESVVIHDGHGSMAQAGPGWDYHFTRSSLVFFGAHAPVPLVPAVVSVTGRLVMRLLTGRWANAAAVVRAAVVRGAGGPAPGVPGRGLGG
jgi:GT2 family glycosyltransferase